MNNSFLKLCEKVYYKFNEVKSSILMKKLIKFIECWLNYDYNDNELIEKFNFVLNQAATQGEQLIDDDLSDFFNTYTKKITKTLTTNDKIIIAAAIKSSDTPRVLNFYKKYSYIFNKVSPNLIELTIQLSQTNNKSFNDNQKIMQNFLEKN